MNKFSHRKIVPEIIDDFNWSGKDLEQNLEEIEWVNKNLGGTKASAYPVLTYIQKNLDKDITVADIGCGSGDVLKKIQTACKDIKKIHLTGVDANKHIIEFAEKSHFKEQEISFVHADVINQPELIPRADVYMLNLFLHHFEEKEIRTIIGNLLAHQPALIVVNDLQRSQMAYFLFSLLCKLQNASFVTFNDGRLSILKGFNKKEMQYIGDMVGNYSYTLKWQWAFRWLLMIQRK
jgi:2-polyprenyl-3-methyl-5-hydroxy-6-metoxy-1,4-benzoquinol methylase